MCGKVRIGAKLLAIQEATDILNNMGFAADFSDAAYIFSLEFLFDAAITIVDGCESSIRGSSQEIAEAEAI